MSFVRSATLRASSIARCARPASCFRAAELQPWRRAVQRRTYASSHGGTTKTSDLPWLGGAIASTAVGLYIVMSQDLGHGEHDDEHHGDAHAKHEKPKEEAPAEEKEEDEPAEKGDSKEEKAEASPDKSDKPDPHKEPKSQNEMSGKQEGMSNADTKHTHSVSEDPEKSKKGEGVAESAKLKGTVSTERPAAENKEERGKAQQDKSQ